QCSQTVFYTTAVASSSKSPRSAQAAKAIGAAGTALPPPPRRESRKPKQARRSTLSVEAVVAAAIALPDEAGGARLSMRPVAHRLGTGAASLYAYVSGKDELLELVYDELVGSVPLPEPDPAHWREQLKAMMTGLYEVLVSHRDAALAGLGR